MVTVLHDVPIPGVEVIPCRQNGPRGIVKSFVLHDDNSVILVDAGFSDEDADLILDRITSIGRRPEDISMCILTHPHGDHIGGLKKLRSQASFPVLIHGKDEAYFEKAYGSKPDRLLDDNEVLPEFGSIEIVPLPGHTPGSVGLYLQPLKALVTGDAILSAGEHLVVSPVYLCSDPEAAGESVRKLLSSGRDIETLLISHGDDIYGRAKTPLQRIFAGPRPD
jgi:glyoxylase-like metal-dependent hydrolase (beta-lactamase superfamily II)